MHFLPTPSVYFTPSFYFFINALFIFRILSLHSCWIWNQWRKLKFSKVKYPGDYTNLNIVFRLALHSVSLPNKSLDIYWYLVVLSEQFLFETIRIKIILLKPINKRLTASTDFKIKMRVINHNWRFKVGCTDMFVSDVSCL